MVQVVDRDYLDLVRTCRSLSRAKRLHSRVAHTRDPFLLNKIIEMYGNCGDPRSARRVFDGIALRNRFSWDLMLVAYTQSLDLADSRDFFDSMPQHSLVSATAMLRLLAEEGDVAGARTIFHERMPLIDIISCNAMLDAYAQAGCTLLAKRLLHQMPEHDLISWASILICHLQTKNLEELNFVFRTMPFRDLVSWNIVLNANAKHGHLQHTKDLFLTVPQRDAFTCTAMITAFVRHRHLEDAKLAFDKMPFVGTVTWNTLIGGYAQHGYLGEARDWLAQMPERSVVSWNILLAGFAENGTLHESEVLFWNLQAKDIRSWNLMLFAYARQGHLEETGKLFRAMPERSIVSWSSMLAAAVAAPYSRNGDDLRVEWDAFVVFHSAMAEESPDEVCFLSILSACSKRGLVEKGGFLLASMSFDYGIEPRRYHFSCVVDLLGRSGYLGDALELLSSMPFVAEALDWACFLGSCRSHRALELGSKAAPHILGRDRDGGAMILLANTYLEDHQTFMARNRQPALS